MTEEQIKAIQAENENMKMLMAAIYHRTMADPDAEESGSSAVLSADEVKAMKAVARKEVGEIDHFLRPVWSKHATEMAIENAREMHDLMWSVRHKAQRLYRHNDAFSGLATIAHAAHTNAIWVCDAMEFIIKHLEGEVEAGARDPGNAPRWEVKELWAKLWAQSAREKTIATGAESAEAS